MSTSAPRRCLPRESAERAGGAAHEHSAADHHEAIAAAGTRLCWGTGWAIFGWVSTDGTSCAAVVDEGGLFEFCRDRGNDMF